MDQWINENGPKMVKWRMNQQINENGPKPQRINPRKIHQKEMD
jgi:hypothetical protein